MLNQPMIEKLLAMRLNGMVEALKARESGAGPEAESRLSGVKHSFRSTTIRFPDVV
jgi:hypothetical protein